MKNRLYSLILVLILLVGLSVMLYPTVSDYINVRNQSYAIGSYEEQLSKVDSEDFEHYFAEAERYNQELVSNPIGFYKPEEIPGYYDALDVAGNGVMGYITIPAIRVSLPIYHGTAESVLNTSVGHLEGSTLPIGGENTHCVLVGHRGLPSAKLFTNLDQMEKGDIFTVTVMNRVMTYQVDQIVTVEPDEMEELLVKPGKDYVTLLTCTPYGVNTHRLLVRGKRVENESDWNDSNYIYVAADANLIDRFVVALVISIPILLLLLVVVLIRYPKKRRDV